MEPALMVALVGAAFVGWVIGRAVATVDQLGRLVQRTQEPGSIEEPAHARNI